MARSDLIQRELESQLVRARAGSTKLPTVASIARATGISRESLYRYHARIVSQIQSLRRNSSAKKEQQLRAKLQLLTRQLQREKETSAALARICAELAANAAAIKAESEDERLSLELRIDHLEKKLRGSKTLSILRSR